MHGACTYLKGAPFFCISESLHSQRNIQLSFLRVCFSFQLSLRKCVLHIYLTGTEGDRRARDQGESAPGTDSDSASESQEGAAGYESNTDNDEEEEEAHDDDESMDNVPRGTKSRPAREFCPYQIFSILDLYHIASYTLYISLCCNG